MRQTIKLQIDFPHLFSRVVYMKQLITCLGKCSTPKNSHSRREKTQKLELRLKNHIHDPFPNHIHDVGNH